MSAALKVEFAASVIEPMMGCGSLTQEIVMWAMKTTREWESEDGVVHQEECVDVQQSWYEVGVEGLVGLWVAFWVALAMMFFTPFLMAQTAYRQFRYANCPVPQNEVRERAHFG